MRSDFVVVLSSVCTVAVVGDNAVVGKVVATFWCQCTIGIVSESNVTFQTLSEPVQSPGTKCDSCSRQHAAQSYSTKSNTILLEY